MSTVQPQKNGIIGLKDLYGIGSSDAGAWVLNPTVETSLENNYDSNVFANNKSHFSGGGVSIFQNAMSNFGNKKTPKMENGVMRFGDSTYSPSLFSNNASESATSANRSSGKIASGMQLGNAQRKSVSIFG